MKKKKRKIINAYENCRRKSVTCLGSYGTLCDRLSACNKDKSGL